MTDEVLKLALDALEGFIPYLPLKDEAQCNRYDKAITALRLVIDSQNMASKSTYKEQLETKDAPVAWMSEDEHTVYTSKQVDGCFQHDHIPLYTTPQQGCDECGVGGGYALYCLPCAEKFVGNKEWISLTDEDMGFLFPHGKSAWLTETLKVFEAKLKQKNNIGENN